jgi:CubicO group peptidase (beta-lactamase class C family)
MHFNPSTIRHTVLQRLFTANLLRGIAVLAIGLWLSACDRSDDEFTPPAQTPGEAKLAQKIDSLLMASMQKGTAPGMAAVVIKGGKVIFQKNYGYADVAAKILVTNNTRFAIGSTTKAMTAYGVLRLVDQGLVKLDEQVTTYLPDFVMNDARYKEITVAQLLSHSSGLKSWTELTPPSNAPGAIENIIKTLTSEDLAFAPGQGFYYSNYGTTLAGLIIQRVAKIPYEAYIQQNLFTKIGMPSSTMEYWRPNALEGTKGYVLDTVQQRLIEMAPYFDRSYNPAGSGTISTSNDVARYLTTVANNYATPSGEKLLSDAMVARMFTGSINRDQDEYVQFLGATGGSHAFGWYNINRNGYVTIEHGGNIRSMLSAFLVDPKTKSAVGILVNQEDFAKFTLPGEIARLVFAEQ